MSVFSHVEFDQHERVVYGYDKRSGLKAIIAIHDSRLGPALGGAGCGLMGRTRRRCATYCGCREG